MAKNFVLERGAEMEDPFSDWGALITERVQNPNGQWHSPADMLLRKQYELARDGNRLAVQVMMKMLKANTEERAKRKAYYSEWDDPVAMRRRRARQRDECRADPALLLLGIAVVENHLVTFVGEPGSPDFETRLSRMRPTHLASWVVDFAQTRPCRPALGDFRWRDLGGGILADDDERCRQWQEKKAMLLGRIAAVRGPEGVRFNQGKSANPRGRPRRKNGPPADDYPFDGFFMEPISVALGGKQRQLTRLDALMLSLTVKAAKGDDKIAAIIAPVIADLVKLNWDAARRLPVEESRI